MKKGKRYSFLKDYEIQKYHESWVKMVENDTGLTLKRNPSSFPFFIHFLKNSLLYNIIDNNNFQVRLEILAHEIVIMLQQRI